MDRSEILRERLEQAFRTSRFHSFLGSLKGLTDEEARWKPPHYQGYPHMDGSILNLAFHTGGDKHVLAGRSFGDSTVTWDLVQRRFEELGGNLEAARSLAEEGHARVLDCLEARGEGGLDESRPYYGGKLLPASEILAIIAEHDVYHAGQIRFVRNLLKGRKREE